MKVKNLIDILNDFNPKAEVYMRVNDNEYTINGIYGWSSGDSDDYPRDIAMEKMTSEEVSLDCGKNSTESQYIV